MAAQLQQLTVTIPKGYDSPTRRAIAQDIIDFIVRRTRQGKGKDGQSFPGSTYSKEYRESLEFRIAGKGSTVDLTLTGEMLNSIEIITTTATSITIGFRAGSEMNAKADGNIRGTYGQSTPKTSNSRPFLELSSSELNLILERYPLNTTTVEPRITGTRALIDTGLVGALRRRLLGIDVF